MYGQIHYTFVFLQGVGHGLLFPREPACFMRPKAEWNMLVREGTKPMSSTKQENKCFVIFPYILWVFVCVKCGTVQFVSLQAHVVDALCDSSICFTVVSQSGLSIHIEIWHIHLTSHMVWFREMMSFGPTRAGYLNENLNADACLGPYKCLVMCTPDMEMSSIRCWWQRFLWNAFPK